MELYAKLVKGLTIGVISATLFSLNPLLTSIAVALFGYLKFRKG